MTLSLRVSHLPRPSEKPVALPAASARPINNAEEHCPAEVATETECPVLAPADPRRVEGRHRRDHPSPLRHHVPVAVAQFQPHRHRVRPRRGADAVPTPRLHCPWVTDTRRRCASAQIRDPARHRHPRPSLDPPPATSPALPITRRAPTLNPLSILDFRDIPAGRSTIDPCAVSERPVVSMSATWTVQQRRRPP